MYHRIDIGEHMIFLQRSVWYLGLMINDRFIWENHIDYPVRPLSIFWHTWQNQNIDPKETWAPDM